MGRSSWRSHRDASQKTPCITTTGMILLMKKKIRAKTWHFQANQLNSSFLFPYFCLRGVLLTTKTSSGQNYCLGRGRRMSRLLAALQTLRAILILMLLPQSRHRGLSSILQQAEELRRVDFSQTGVQIETCPAAETYLIYESAATGIHSRHSCSVSACWKAAEQTQQSCQTNKRRSQDLESPPDVGLGGKPFPPGKRSPPRGVTHQLHRCSPRAKTEAAQHTSWQPWWEIFPNQKEDHEMLFFFSPLY